MTNSQRENKYRFKRIFVLVADSLGIGSDDNSVKYGDNGANTFLHVYEKCGGLNIPNLLSLGINDLLNIKNEQKVVHPQSYVCKLNEASNGKDTLTGHWEMMGIKTVTPFKTFTETGFPQKLINELETKTGHKIIGNYAASGTEIIKELGIEQIKNDALIVYTSSDSVLQIAANVDYMPLKELYRCCEIAREICLKPEYLLGRIIARPYVGETPETFKRTSDRHDYALSPNSETAMNLLAKNGFEVSCIGKINDIFNGFGVTKTQKTTSNSDGLDRTLDEINRNFTGLCFINLVNFDSEFGHRRDPIGYGKCIEELDFYLSKILKSLKEDDLFVITADHGNDPIWTGSDHTREKVPFIAYSKSFRFGSLIKERNSFGDIGLTILDNFKISRNKDLLGKSMLKLLK